jgi:hypothetical protein
MPCMVEELRTGNARMQNRSGNDRGVTMIVVQSGSRGIPSPSAHTTSAPWGGRHRHRRPLASRCTSHSAHPTWGGNQTPSQMPLFCPTIHFLRPTHVCFGGVMGEGEGVRGGMVPRSFCPQNHRRGFFKNEVVSVGADSVGWACPCS